MRKRLAQIFMCEVDDASMVGFTHGFTHIAKRDGKLVGLISASIAPRTSTTYNSVYIDMSDLSAALRCAQFTGVPLTIVVGFSDKLVYWAVNMSGDGLEWIVADSRVSLSVPIKLFKAQKKIDWDANTKEYIEGLKNDS